MRPPFSAWERQCEFITWLNSAPVLLQGASLLFSLLMNIVHILAGLSAAPEPGSIVAQARFGLDQSASSLSPTAQDSLGLTMAWTLDDILPQIVNAGDAGLTGAAILKKLGKPHQEKLAETLKSLVHAKKIRGPVKHGTSQYYFAADWGPSAEVTCSVICERVKDSGIKLVSLTALKDKVTGIDGKFFNEGLKLALASKKVIQLTCGRSKYLLHCETAQKHFALPAATPMEFRKSPEPHASELTLQAVRPVFHRLKAEQGGLGTIDIYDLMKALGVSKDTLHPFLLREAKAGHLTIHPTTTVQLKPEVIDAAIRLPGFAEPFITVALKDES